MNKLKIAGAVLALVVAFAAGWRVAPSKEKIVFRDRVERVTVTDTKAQTKRTRVSKPDGTVIERETVREVAHVTETKQETRAVTETKPAPYMPSWSVGALVTANPSAFRLADPMGSLSGGLLVSRRVLGPMWLGMSATVPLSRPVSVPIMGLFLSVQF